MRPGSLAAALLAALLLSAAPAATLASPTPRDENRQVLLAEEGTSWDPNALVLVVTGSADDFDTHEVTKATALEMELDYLDAANIRLLDLLAPTAATTSGTNPQPTWPALGTFTARETGWYSTGARCPSTTLTAPSAVVELYNQLRGTTATSLGLFETTISEHWQKTNADGTKSEYGSSLQHVDTNGATKTYFYGRDAPVTKEGWSLRFAFEASIAPGSTFFCREETLAANGVDRVRLTGKFTPFGDRFDD